MDEASQRSAAGESLLKYGVPWILSGLGAFLGSPAVGNAAAFFLILGLCAFWPMRIKPVEVVLGCFFLLIWIGADWLHVPCLLACQSYLAPASLALLAFGFLAIGHPFTLVYAREWVSIIPAVSAMSILHQNGCERALRAGANLTTINLTPEGSRENYLLYKKDRFIMSEQRVLQAVEAADLKLSSISLWII